MSAALNHIVMKKTTVVVFACSSRDHRNFMYQQLSAIQLPLCTAMLLNFRGENQERVIKLIFKF